MQKLRFDSITYIYYKDNIIGNQIFTTIYK